MSERLTRWVGRDETGPRAVLVKRGHFPTDLQEALRKLARYEDEVEAKTDCHASAAALARNDRDGGAG